MSTIVAATDFSEAGELAVQQAVAFARRQRAELVVVYADILDGAAPDAFERSGTQLTGIRKAIRRRLCDASERLSAIRVELAKTGVTARTKLVDGFPDTAIAKYADELGAAWLAIGARDGLLGGIGHRIVRASRCPVLVVRSPLAEPGFRRVLVATDFSPSAERALGLAADMATPGGELELFHVAAIDGGEVPAGCEATASLERHERPDLRTSYRIDTGPPTTRILHELANGDGFGLLALGTHGRRGWRRWALGSVAEQLVRYARCSVLVAPPVSG